MNEPTPRGERFAGSELNFLPDAQQVLSLAQKEAYQLKHHFLGTEHLLLGLIALGHGVGFSVLVKLGLDLETLRKEIERQIGTSSNQKPVGHPPYTPRAKKVIALAQKEAHSLSHTYLGTEHLLLGLLREGDGVAGKVLKGLGVELEKTRQEILKELDPNLQPGASDAQKESTKEKSPAEPRFESSPEPLLTGEASHVFSDFTPRAQQVFHLAQKEAERFKHPFIGTEHVLLGLIALGQGVAVNVLLRHGMDLESTRQDVEKLVGIGPDRTTTGHPYLAPYVIKVVSHARIEAQQLHHAYIGTEHLLLGLLKEGDGLAVKIICARNIDPEEVRNEILRELDPNYSARERTAEKPQTEPLRDWLSRYLKPDPVDLTKRYDVYCIQHGESTVYRNVLFKNVKGLLQDRETNLHALYIELELADGKSVFLPKSAILKFADPGASAAGEKIPPSGKT